MAFKPRNQNNGKGKGSFEYKDLPVPKDGPRPARVSLIVDLGIQEREDFENDDGTKKKQDPCHQIAMFADLVNDKVDYGGDIGVQQYRLPLFGTFSGKVKPLNFVCYTVRDANGEPILDSKGGKQYALPGMSPITKLCKAVGMPDLPKQQGKNPPDLEKLLGQAFMAQVEVKITEKGEGEDKRVYKNVNYKGASPIPMVPVMDADGEPTGDEAPMKVAKLTQEPRVISFDSATKEDIQIIRSNLRKLIKLALDYPGSQMQKAMEAWEAENEKEGEEAEAPAPAPAPAKKAVKKVEKPAAPAPESEDDGDSDLPF